MKKFLFILFIIVATKHQLIGQNYYNQHCPQPSGTMACQPNVSPLDSGFTPMPSHVNQIKKGIYFEETFTLQNYSNIDIPGAIFLDSLKFDSIFNLPTGLCWQTNDANDFFAN